MTPFDEAWMQNISLIMYLVILLNMVRLWLTFHHMRVELDEVFDMVGEMHHQMGLCDCEEPGVIVLPLSQLERHFEDGVERANTEAIREWDEA